MTTTSSSPTDSRPSVVLLAGSLRRPSYTHGLCRALAESLDRAGLAATLFDMRDQALPLADAAWHRDPASHPDPVVRRMVAAVDGAAAIVLATPLYHNGPSGALKNTLDLLSIPQLAYKPVGLASHGGGRTTQAVDQMRIWVRGLLGHAIATQVCTDRRDFTEAAATDPATDGPHTDPQLADPLILQRVDRFAQEMVVMAQVMRVARQALI
ncbi:NAD(P)H-dependent oxidoreductase [Tistrella bauzanensis]|uniref:NADPH-dependent FMN reductase n=1 Tax=Tistrella arctica TaxID=3133430 RepID=A0ABU9YHD1_9PROT